MEIRYNHLRLSWSLIGSSGKEIFESYLLSDVKKFREQFLDQQENDDGA